MSPPNSAQSTDTTVITPSEAAQLALNFLMEEWEISADDQEWFAILSNRFIGETWYVVEIGVEGLPDKWVIQVYDTGECDPNYTFNSFGASGGDTDLAEMPERIAEVIMAERNTCKQISP